ncbi:MAG: SgcJ/EcaC family oxidoreductase [Leptolyngbya sp. SIO1E4]|nr:SgcJ/EcaC family oxidoreductase [Leptolyngbya sp. SIO1E4]
MSQTTRASQTIEAVIQLARQAWLEGNGPAFTALFSTTGEFIVPGQKWQGQDSILQAFQAFAAAYSVNAINIHNQVIQGNRAMLEWYWEDTELLTGNVSKAEDAIAIDFQGDLIQRWREYIDTKSFG